jgi:HD-GYP domain-containing protein (c-di-GMP phosphodiesterase class II)
LRELKMARTKLSRQVADLQQKLESRSMGGVMALANALEARDPYTKGHSARVADLSLRLAEALDYPPDQKEQIGVGALLHDVGKIAVPDAILLKKSPLTREEQQAVRLHPRVGCDILLPLFGEGIVTDCALRHHERADGRGYPEGLAVDRCPQAGRIIAVADAYDAMTSERPYRRAFTATAALSEIESHRGTQFDAEIVDLFCDLESRRNGQRDERQEDNEQ